MNMAVSAPDAIDRVAKSLSGSVAILHTTLPTLELRLSVATMTAFGPSVRTWEPTTQGFLDQVCEDSRTALRHVRNSEILVCQVGDPGEHDALLARFRSLRPRIPERGNPLQARSTWWARADICEQIKKGDPLVVSVEQCEGMTAIRYRTKDGLAAGVHALIDRPPSPAEMAIVKRAEAIVTSVTYGSAPDIEGNVGPSLLLMLDVPSELAKAFPDGVLPMNRRRSA